MSTPVRQVLNIIREAQYPSCSFKPHLQTTYNGQGAMLGTGDADMKKNRPYSVEQIGSYLETNKLDS